MKKSKTDRDDRLKKLTDGKDWTLENLSRRANTREDLAKAVFSFASDLSAALKWMEKIHGDHFATMQELIKAKEESENKAVNAVNSLRSTIDKTKQEPVSSELLSSEKQVPLV
ncbi:MAG: hypothetical protein GY816_20390 [Cytophagales bacterium]|nr:hypothetical protein [Cytophagales bacterium]